MKQNLFQQVAHVLGRTERQRGMLTAMLAWTMTWLLPHYGSAVEIPPEIRNAQQQRVEVMASAASATVSVFDGTGQGGGSGVLISPDGYVLTNYHVTSPAGNFMKCSLPDGRIYEAVIVGLDPTGDVALIQLFGRDDFPVAIIGNSDRVRVGDWCFAVGNPFLLATDFQPTITYGIISGVHRYQHPSGTLLEYTDCIQTDASINPGNSGGPLFDDEGNLIGINGRISVEKRGRVNVGVGYAISIHQVQNFMGYLRSGRIVDHATLGASVSTDEEGRVIVTNILGSSDAYRRGLRYADEIVQFAGRRIGSVNGFKNVLGTLPKGWRVPLTYRRDGEDFDCFVRLAGVHRHEELLAKAAAGISPPAPIPHPQPDQPDSEDGEKPADENQQKNNQEESPRHEAADIANTEEQEKAIQSFTSRRGFANYYFNLQNRSRVWEDFLANFHLAESATSWQAVGELHDGRTVYLEYHLDGAIMRLGDEHVELNGELDLSDQSGPQRSGGLLAALHIWHRMLIHGPERFGEVIYLGTAPIPHQDKQFEVFVATHNVVESWFYFDPDTGHLVLLEMYPERDVDPCEVYFSEYADIQGSSMPHRLQVQFGNHAFGTVNVESWNMAVPIKDAT